MLKEKEIESKTLIERSGIVNMSVRQQWKDKSTTLIWTIISAYHSTCNLAVSNDKIFIYIRNQKGYGEYFDKKVPFRDLDKVPIQQLWGWPWETEEMLKRFAKLF